MNNPDIKNKTDQAQQTNVNLPQPEITPSPQPKYSLGKKILIFFLVTSVLCVIVGIGSKPDRSNLVNAGCPKALISQFGRFTKEQSCKKQADVTILPSNKKFEIYDLYWDSTFDLCVDTCHTDSKQVEFFTATNQVKPPRDYVESGLNSISGSLKFGEPAFVGCPIDTKTTVNTETYFYESGNFANNWEFRSGPRAVKDNKTNFTCKYDISIFVPLLKQGMQQGKRKLKVNSHSFTQELDCKKDDIYCLSNKVIATGNANQCLTLLDINSDNIIKSDAIDKCIGFFAISKHDTNLCKLMDDAKYKAKLQKTDGSYSSLKLCRDSTDKVLQQYEII